MVVFTCNNCGDSVNKPKVDKHIQYECKRKHFAVSFCCVDCLKDFNIDTVKDHCQCVTEEQRYSAKGFVPKASAEKGKRKQAGWVDVVQSVINRKDLQNDERQFLNIISKFDNVPRKKNKFQNFCFSTAPTYRKKGYVVDKVFDMIEAEYKAQQIQNLSEKQANTNNNQNDTKNIEKNDSVQEEKSQKIKKKKNFENDEKTESENTNNDTQETPVKKKKKNKQSIDAINNKTETISEENVEPASGKKNKKVKKSLENNTVTEQSSEINDLKTTEAQSDSKKKSKKNKNKLEINGSNGINENGISVTENGVTNGVNETIQENTESLSKKEKKELKKKKKYKNELANVANNVIETDKEPISKKKKRKLNDNVENEEPQPKLLKTENTPEVPEIQSKRKFEWNEAINQVLSSKKSKPMSTNKVMKRVMNEYHSLNETTTKSQSDLEKIFLKKLRKMKNVVINNDKVKLLEC